MKPKDLKPPFTWEERQVHLEGGILYIPSHYDRYDAFAMPSWETLFGRDAPVAVEFCSGHGHWIVEKAESHPEINWVAVEIQFERVRKIWSKRENRGLKNLFVVAGDARLFARYYLCPESVDAVYVNFPDPWPKKRHAKHRLIQPPFSEHLARGMKRGGELTLVTDDLPYREQMEEELSKVEELSKKEEETGLGEYGTSYFRELWTRLGRDFYRLIFSRA